jgi:hypothetical protein
MTEFEQGLVVLVAVIVGAGGGIMGAVIGCEGGRKDATRSATIECVNKPKECKIRYDYYQIERKSDR